jgi:glucose uptake protein GlcU
MSLAVGYLCVAVASLFWGSNFIVTKGYEMHDGMHFQHLLCTGILAVGCLTLPWHEGAVHGVKYDAFPLPDLRVVLSTEGLLGGLIWAMGNLLTVPIVQRIGVGLGLSIWGGTSMVVTFLFSRLSIFGLEPDELHVPAAGYVGALLGCLSLAIFSFVETDTKAGNSALARPLTAADDEESSGLLRGRAAGGDEQQGQLQQPPPPPEAGAVAVAQAKRERVVGIAFAFLAGCLYGVQFVPLSIHGQQYPRPAGEGDLTHQIRFFFSQFLGIYLTSLAAFCVYLARRGKSAFLLPPQAMLPSVLSGVLWTVACMASMLAISTLGLGIGYPLTSNGAFLCNAAWSIFYFKEVTGRRNLQVFAAASATNIAGCICLAIARS